MAGRTATLGVFAILPAATRSATAVRHHVARRDAGLQAAHFWSLVMACACSGPRSSLGTAAVLNSPRPSATRNPICRGTHQVALLLAASVGFVCWTLALR